MESRQQGFTLIEAVVALLILTMAMTAAFSWVNVSIATLLRSDEILTRHLLVNQLLEELPRIDFEQEQTGEIRGDGLNLRWEADEMLSASGVNNLGALGYHDHFLYRVGIRVYRGDTLIAEYETRALNSRLVRQPEVEL